ncbi:hypothetical protein Pla123a_15190 [Posidoniimonas polymericola]|uniref:DUF3566 domain-containing protein n=1 Tax=Posidoniimonas polymericola TaxID=2528002 RepID=A0A5C5YSF4_9BACT|nr:hypothetical protein [Posidoniimonas polymericola]TWT77723.1 hypothetical protein Pla123a_15190 [Posidoniimonas polymericola]
MSSNPFESPVSDSSGYQAPGRASMTLKSIDPLQAGKVLGALYLLLGLIVAPFLVLGALLSGDPAQAGVGLGMAVGILFMYGVGGFLGGLLMAFLYNVVAKMSGGMRFEFE